MSLLLGCDTWLKSGSFLFHGIQGHQGPREVGEVKAGDKLGPLNPGSNLL